MKKMRNIKLLAVLIILIPAGFSGNAYGQCTNSSSYGSATAPTGTSAVTISTRITSYNVCYTKLLRHPLLPGPGQMCLAEQPLIFLHL